MERLKTEVVIYGAGPSGTVAAAKLNQLGREVHILEKSQFPRFVIGESLLPRCMAHFEEAGLLDVLKKQGYQKKHGARFIRGDKSCLFNFGEQYTQGWTWTWQVPRADFDKVLADEVERRGVNIHYQSAVQDVLFEDDKVITTYTNKSGETCEIESAYVIDASGYGRVLPRLLSLEKPSDLSPKKALFAHFKDENRPGGASGQQITFVINDVDLWVWIIPFSTGITSVGIVGDYRHFDTNGMAPEQELRQHIANTPQIAARFFNAPITESARSINAFAIASKQLYGPRFVITGNSSEFLDPVFSSGVTFATESGLKAAGLINDFLNGQSVDWEKEYVGHMRSGIDTFRTYVDRWYDGSLQDIFFFTSDEKSRVSDIKNKICSVLAGYVWDESNPFVSNRRDRALKTLAQLVNF